MLWLEMSRDPLHGGKGWGFTECLWAPTHKEDGKSDWPFWRNVMLVRRGEPVLHLRGGSKDAAFVGISTAASDGFTTANRPPAPGKWNYATEFRRADLTDFVPFSDPIKLKNVFASRDQQLRDYFQLNQQRTRADRLNLFYVVQSDKLQCLNGAYLSHADSQLVSILLGDFQPGQDTGPPVLQNITTKQAARILQTRLGQDRFAEMVLSNFGAKCCFPGCGIADRLFLVGAHIARWADVPELRGNIGNGLCFCLMHDKAFEDGLFTIGADLTIIAAPGKHPAWSLSNILPFSGQTIAKPKAPPIIEALEHHWTRHGFIISKGAAASNAALI